MNASKLLPAALALAAVVPVTASAAQHPTADAAMRKGIRDYAAHGLEKTGPAKASQIRVSCKPVTKVGQKRACTGTFRLTLHGKRADYRLTSSARTLRISPGAIEYRVSAKTTDGVKGLPHTIGAFTGFLQ